MGINIDKKSNRRVMLREGIILSGILLSGLLIFVFSPSPQYPHYTTFQQTIGIYLSILGYPFYWFIRLIILVVSGLRKPKTVHRKPE